MASLVVPQIEIDNLINLCLIRFNSQFSKFGIKLTRADVEYEFVLPRNGFNNAIQLTTIIDNDYLVLRINIKFSLSEIYDISKYEFEFIENSENGLASRRYVSLAILSRAMFPTLSRVVLTSVYGVVSFTQSTYSGNIVTVTRAGGVTGNISVDILDESNTVIHTLNWTDGEDGDKEFDTGISTPNAIVHLSNIQGGASIGPTDTATLNTAVQPDLTPIYGVVGARSDILIYNMARQKLLTLRQPNEEPFGEVGKEYFYNPTFSPNGTMFAVSRGIYGDAYIQASPTSEVFLNIYKGDQFIELHSPSITAPIYVTGVAFSPDSTKIAVTGTNIPTAAEQLLTGHTYIFNTDTLELIADAAIGGQDGGISWKNNTTIGVVNTFGYSSQGETPLTNQNNSVVIAQITSNGSGGFTLNTIHEITPNFQPSDIYQGYVSFNHAGTLMAFYRRYLIPEGNFHSDVIIINTSTWEVVHTIYPDGAPGKFANENVIKWSSDDSKLIVAWLESSTTQESDWANSGLDIFNTQTWNVIHTIDSGESGLSPPNLFFWSDDDSVIATEFIGSGDGTEYIKVYSTTDWTTSTGLTPPPFSDDGWLSAFTLGRSATEITLDPCIAINDETAPSIIYADQVMAEGDLTVTIPIDWSSSNRIITAPVNWLGDYSVYPDSVPDQIFSIVHSNIPNTGNDCLELRILSTHVGGEGSFGGTWGVYIWSYLRNTPNITAYSNDYSLRTAIGTTDGEILAIRYHVNDGVLTIADITITTIEPH